jgi:hypothetical protein
MHSTTKREIVNLRMFTTFKKKNNASINEISCVRKQNMASIDKISSIVILWRV